jgi:hypothetical protein
VPGGSILHEGDFAVGAPELVIARARHQEFFEDCGIGLEAGGVEIRDIVRHHVEFATQRHLPRQPDEKCILHRRSPM